MIKVQGAQSMINNVALLHIRPNTPLLCVQTYTFVFKTILIYKELRITDRVWALSEVLQVNMVCTASASLHKGRKRNWVPARKQPYFCMWQLQDHCWINTCYLCLKYTTMKNWKRPPKNTRLSSGLKSTALRDWRCSTYLLNQRHLKHHLIIGCNSSETRCQSWKNEGRKQAGLREKTQCLL